VDSSLLGERVEECVRELASLGGAIQEVDVHEFGDSAAIHAFIAFGARRCGLLTVFEFVRSEGGELHTRRYAYQATRDGDFLFRFDYDPIAHPDAPAHKHLPGGGDPAPGQRVTLREVVRELEALLAAGAQGDPSHN
jgi:hypothetical protein